MPLDDSVFPYEAQVAFFIHSFMSQNWDNINGYYMGCDWSNIEFLCKTYQVINIKEVLLFIKTYDEALGEIINKKVSEKNKDTKDHKISVPKGVKRKVNG